MCSQNKYLEKLGELKTYNMSSIDKNCEELENQKSNLMIDIASLKLYRKKNGKVDLDPTILDCLKGKYIDINFDHGWTIVPHTNERLEIKGKFKMMLPLGSTEETDLELTSFSNFSNYFKQLCVKIGVIDKDSDYMNKVADYGGSILCALTCRDVKLKDMTAYTVLQSSFVTLDDAFDNLCDFQTRKLSLLEFSSVIDEFVAIISGEKVLQDCQNNDFVKDYSFFPKFFPLCNLISEIRNEALAVCKKSSQDPKYFIKSFVDYLESCTWETENWVFSSMDAEAPDEKAIKEFYFIVREKSVGLIPCLEMVCLVKNINLSEKVRRDVWLKAFQRTLSRHVILVNDIISLKKEVMNGETSNIILVRNFKNSIRNSFQETLNDLYNCCTYIVNIRDKLLTKFGDDENLREYLKMGMTWLDGHIQWIQLIKRYNSESFSVEIRKN